MPDAIDHLLAEHREIMAHIEPLRAVAAALRREGDQAIAGALPALESAGRMMATQLLRHASKEDDALFPALERVLGTSGTPTTVMRKEHVAIHEHARLFRETLKQLNEVEHPAIVARGEALRALTHRAQDALALQRTAEEILELLDLHFSKEENILFPMAREVLSEEDLAEVADRMAKIDSR